MNNQRRHELEHNVLAGYLGTHLAKLQHLVKPALIAVAAGIVLFLGYSAYQNWSSKESSKAWTEFYFNLNGEADSFADLSQQFQGSAAGQWARHAAAVGYLQDGIEAMYVNRKEGVGLLNSSIEKLKSLQNSNISELKRLANLGLAQAHESLGELDQAIEFYQTARDLPGTPEVQRERISQRISYLQSNEARSFYSWFAQLDPKPAAPPEMTGDLSKPPETPSISFDPASMPALPNASDAPASPPADATQSSELKLDASAPAQPTEVAPTTTVPVTGESSSTNPTGSPEK